MKKIAIYNKHLLIIVLLLLLILTSNLSYAGSCSYDSNGDGSIDVHDKATDPLLGDTTCNWGDADCNPCVYDVEDNFYHISDNNGHHNYNTQLRIEARDDSGEIMCLYSPNCELTTFYSHIQGIGRIPDVDDNNWFVFTRSVEGPGAFFAGQMTDMLSAGGHLGAAMNEDDSARQITEYYTMDMASVEPTALNHYGGLQMLGKHMVTGTECYASGSYECPEDPEMVYFYDFSDPTNVDAVDAINLEEKSLNKGIAVGAAKLANGRYLSLVYDYSLHFLVSDSLDTSSDWECREDFGTGSVTDGGAGNTSWADPQNINLVTECETGNLYMITTYRGHDDVEPVGEDWMLLFLIETDEEDQVLVSKIAQKHMYCEWCNFIATGNIYITPERNMVLYASDKDDEDGILGSGDILFEEFQNSYNQCNDEDDDDCDYDGDGLTNLEEEGLGTNKFLADTDEDGLDDGEEVNDYGTDPLNEDSDGEGLSDGDEVNTYGTDPNNTDSDGDGIEDGVEVEYGLDPADSADGSADNDGDGLTNAQEINDYGTDINNSDTDGDSLEDGFEVNDFGSDPTLTDTDSDGLLDNLEFSRGTDPNDTDSDDDALSDGDEVNIYGTDPSLADSDSDGLDDGTEIELETDPQNNDTDGDGLTDGEEVNTHSTDPLNTDSDNDDLNDYEEVNDYGTSPIDNDSDDEGLLDGEEVLNYETDPLDADTDDDEWTDYQEVNAGITKDPLEFDNLVQTRQTHDFNGDGKSDLLAYYPNGEFRVIKSTGSSFNSAQSWVTGVGESNAIPLADDFNGDGKVDVALLLSSSGEITVALSTGSGFSDNGTWVSGFGTDSAIQLTGDYDGNGKDDVAVMDSDGNWQVVLSNGSSFSNDGSWLSTAYHDADTVLTGDFDGDGLDDLLGLYASTGEVYVSLSTSSGFSSPILWQNSFGSDSSEQFVGDFDGNGQDDLIAYQSDGSFEVALSLGDSFEDRGTLGNSFSTNTNQMAVGDFTGDLRVDVAGYVTDSDNAGWDNASWTLFYSNGSYLLDVGDWGSSESGASQFLKKNLNRFDNYIKKVKTKIISLF